MDDRQLFVPQDGLDGEDYVIALYSAESASPDLLERAKAIALEQTVGTWVPVPEETEEVRARHSGRVLGVYEIPDYEMELPASPTRRYVMAIAFPAINFGPNIPMLLSTTIGNISMIGRLKLLDLIFPPSFLAGFQGPRFGVQGVRELLGVKERPLLNNMIKPCTGIPPEVGARLFYEAARGGADIVKDDELLADAPFSSVAERVKLFMAMEKRAYEETGEHTLYAVNVTDRVDRLRETARRAVEGGVNCLMLNYLTVGIDALRMLAEDPELGVPILAHLDFAGVLYASCDTGMSSHLVLGKLPRLAGADVVVFPCAHGKFAIVPEKHRRIALALTSPLRKIRPAFPMAGGGVYPGSVPQLMRDLGNDCVLGAGGAIHGHPQGPAAGARAMRQAIDATLASRPLSEAAKEHPELAAALAAWGVLEAESPALYSIK